MPLNRFITFVKPYLNLIAGAIAAWLVAKANVLGISGLGANGNELQTGIAGALAWVITQSVTQLGDLKWIKGHHLAMAGDTQVQAAMLSATAMTPASAGPDPAHAVLDWFQETLPSFPDTLPAFEETLPSHGEEFAAAGMDSPTDVTLDAPESDIATFMGQEDLPDDDEEFAAPPPDETNMPLQPSQVQMEGTPS